MTMVPPPQLRMPFVESWRVEVLLREGQSTLEPYCAVVWIRRAPLAVRTVEFLFYHLLLSVVDHVSRLPRHSTLPEAMRLYRENIRSMRPATPVVTRAA